MPTEPASGGAKVLVLDYHLTLLPRLLRDLRPDLRIAHLSHTPWAPVDYFREVSVRLPPRQWLADQVDALD
jgi:trehalose-6-phosphate synthase